MTTNDSTSTAVPQLELVSHKLRACGQKLIVSNFASDTLINSALAADAVWEPWQLNLMSRIIRPEFTCVDIGANVGINAMFMAKLCPQGRVFAFEPFNRIYDVLSKNVAQNELTNV